MMSTVSDVLLRLVFVTTVLRSGAFATPFSDLGLDLEDINLPTDASDDPSNDTFGSDMAISFEDGAEVFHMLPDEVEDEDDESEMTFSDAVHSMDAVQQNVKADFSIRNTTFIKDFMKNCSKLFKTLRTDASEDQPMPQTFSGFHLMTTMEMFGKRMALKIGNPKLAMRSLPLHYKGLWMDITKINVSKMTYYRFPTSQRYSYGIPDSIIVPREIFELKGRGVATIITTAYDPFYEMTSVNATDRSAFLDGRVISTVVEPKPEGNFKKDIILVFKRNKISSNSERSCIFWDYKMRFTKFGGWSTKGCRVSHYNETHTTCKCNHLTDFSVLFRVTKQQKVKGSKPHRVALKWITIVGCSVTITCLTMSMSVFLFFRNLFKSDRNVIHFNLAFCLLIANILFLLSEKAKENKITCALVTTGMLFFFLAAFAWMLMEGIYIWIKLVNVFSSAPPTWIYFAIVYGFAALICAVTSAVLREDIVHESYCWLPVTKGAIWAFVGPALLIILVNLIILVRSLFISMDHQKDNLFVTTMRTAAKLMILLTPILGFTWLFGIFAINEASVVFQYLFTSLNSLQGFFIFIVYVVKNKEVHYEYNRFIRRRTSSSSTSRFSSGNHICGQPNKHYNP